MLISKAIPYLNIPSSTTSTIKSCKIIIKLNNSQIINSIKKKPVKDITSIINRHMEKQGKKAIWAIKKLWSSNIAVQIINKDKTKSLRNESSWGNIFEKKAKAVKPTYGVIIFNVRTNKINLKEKEKSINIIREKNKRVESLCTMKISWLGWFKLPKLG